MEIYCLWVYITSAHSIKYLYGKALCIKKNIHLMVKTL